MNSKEKRDSKDPQPTADNSQREGGGNEPYPAGDSKHGQKKAEKVKEGDRYTLRTGGETQPTRNTGGPAINGVQQTGGNVASTQAKEDHNQSKAERISADRRF
jgi:hypothetical protein